MAPLKPLPGFENVDDAGGARHVSALARNQLAVMPSARPDDDIFGALQAGQKKEGLAGMLDDLSNMLGPPVKDKDKDKKDVSVLARFVAGSGPCGGDRKEASRSEFSWRTRSSGVPEGNPTVTGWPRARLSPRPSPWPPCAPP